MPEAAAAAVSTSAPVVAFHDVSKWYGNVDSFHVHSPSIAFA